MTDNSGAAFYATKPTVPLTFANVTEANWDLSPAREDLPTAIGTAADLTDITTALQAEAVGSSGRWAPMDHVHGHVALAADPHGIAQHTDVTRTLWLDAESATMDTATLATLGTVPDAVRVILYGDTVPMGAFWSFLVPSDYASGAVSFQLYYTPVTSALSDNVRWSVDCKSVAAGASLTAAGTTTTYTKTGASESVGNLVKDTLTSSGVTPGAVGDIFEINVRRLGTDGADTRTNGIHLLGVLISYTGSQ